VEFEVLSKKKTIEKDHLPSSSSSSDDEGELDLDQNLRKVREKMNYSPTENGQRIAMEH
jgi:hypothetical protein